MTVKVHLLKKKLEIRKNIEGSLGSRRAYDKKVSNNPNTDYRDSMIGYMDSKYGGNGHTNSKEYEADRYAANRTSSGEVKEAMRETNKKIASKKAVKRSLSTAGVSYTSKDMKKKRHNINKSSSNDYKNRSKALDDKIIRSSDLYK